MAQEQRKVLTGTIVSNAMDKTVVVRVERTTRHRPLWQGDAYPQKIQRA